MRAIKFVILLMLFIGCFSGTANAQTPLIMHYTFREFGAHRLIWGMTADNYGNIWFANNQGLLRFDGKNWRLFDTEGPIRSLRFGLHQELFYTGTGTAGTIAFTADGGITPQKFSMDQSNPSASTMEKILIAGEKCYLLFNGALYEIIKSGSEYSLNTIAGKGILSAFTNNNQLFAIEAKTGLKRLNGGQLTAVGNGMIMAEKLVTGTAELNGRLILGTAWDGLYVLENNFVTAWNNSVTAIAKSGLAEICQIDQNTIALGTFHQGLLLWDGKDDVRKTDLPSKEIYSLFKDPEGNLWVGHAKGLSHLLLNVPVLQYKFGAISGTINDISNLGQQLLIATGSGLYVKGISSSDQLQQLSSSECWDIEGTLVASTDGLFALKGETLVPLVSNESFLHIQKSNHGYYAFSTGNCYRIETNYAITKLQGPWEDVNSLFEIANADCWAGSNNNGLRRIQQGKDIKVEVPEELQTGKVRILNKEGIALFAKGNDIYLHKDGTFLKDENLTACFGGITQNKSEVSGTDWTITVHGIRSTINNQVQAAHYARLLGDQVNAVCLTGNDLWAGIDETLYQVKTNVLPATPAKANVSALISGKGGLKFSGFFVNKEGQLSATQEIIPEIPYGEGELTLETGCGSFLNPEYNLIRYKIEGAAEEWSEWDKHGSIQLNGISAGRKVLHLKTLNAAGIESEETEFVFYIRPPWYESGLAIMGYACAGILLVYALVWWYSRRLLQKNKSLEAKIEIRTSELKQEKEKSDGLLLNILPVEVAEELKNTGGLKARKFDAVSILFTDFVGFTSISEKLTPEELVDEIHHCFSAYDKIIEQAGLEKIKTVGDAYIAVCGMPQKDIQHALKVVKAAKAIQEFMKTYQEERKSAGRPFFEVRIGINSGPVIAGIVGIKKYAYDIWGDTVNTAARMEQNCDPGKINISGITYEIVKDKFNCSYRGKIEAKNKGRIDMYYV